MKSRIRKIVKKMIIRQSYLHRSLDLYRLANKGAFTLAEVLIVLMIIGLIAAITTLTLINKANDDQLTNAWKEGYSILSQATSAAISDNGGPFTGFSNGNAMKDTFKPYLKYTKECNGSSIGSCWSSGMKLANGGSTAGWADNAGLVLNNGMYVRVYWPGVGCASTMYYSKGECGEFQMDINGPKKPNVFGQDIFVVHVLSSGIKPAGVTESLGLMSAASCSTYGPGCSADVLYK